MGGAHATSAISDPLKVAALDQAVGGLREEEPPNQEQASWKGSHSQRYPPAVRSQEMGADVQALGKQNSSDGTKLEEHRQGSSQLQARQAISLQNPSSNSGSYA